MESIIYVDKPKHFDFSEILWFLDRGYDDCMHTVCEQRVLKAIPTEPSPTLVEISLTKERLQIKILAGGQGTHRQNIVQYVAEWFDLHRDLNEFYNLGNAGLRQLIREFAGLRIVGIPDLFEALCWSIIGQQINLSFAYRIKRNLVEFSGEFIHYEGQKHFLFPTPAKVMEISEATLRDMKFSRQKISYIKSVAEAMGSDDFDFQVLKNLSGDKIYERLIGLKGVGEWTANYILMKTFRIQEAIPYGDAGLNQALKKQLSLTSNPTREQIDTFFKPASGWEAYLTFYLWRSLSKKP